MAVINRHVPASSPSVISARSSRISARTLSTWLVIGGVVSIALVPTNPELSEGPYFNGTTLEETLGFTPKVDFNAGVVAAGEAQIESTVTGNSSPLVTTDPKEALRDRAQVFLPTNNALSPVGHVHWYLEQLGQGIQHVASRVASLPSYVQRANDYRAITGEGFTFLNIPRTYYGLLEPALLRPGRLEAHKGALSGPDTSTLRAE